MTNERDKFLGDCLTKKTKVIVFTTNGFQIRGVILSFDETVIVFRREDGKTPMVYHSAISTIVPE